MSTELATTQKPNGLAISNFSQEQRELLKNTVAQGATDLELQMFLELARAKGLDPFKKEVWFIKGKSYTDKSGRNVEGRVQIMTGVDGFFAIANTNPAYDGIEHAYGPDQKIELNASKAPGVKHIIAPEWVEAVVHRKDRKIPERRRAYWREFSQDLVTYNGNLSLWAQKPTLMLEKCADAIALRKAFPQELGDFRAPEEMPREFSADDEERKTAAEVESQQRANFIAQRTAKLDDGDYTIEHGNSHRGAKVSEATNSIWLERHLEKYREQIPATAQELIKQRIEFLKREHARKMEALEKKEASDGQGWTPTEDELEAIEAEESEEV